MRALLATVVVLLIAAPGAALAANCSTTTIADMEDEVMCPVCGTTLGLAREAPLAKRERALIARLIDSCRTKEQIKTELVAEFGPAVLAEPPDEGIGAAAYLVPIAGGGIVLAGVLMSFGRWRRRDPEPSAAPARAALSSDESRRLETELDGLR